MSATTFIHPEYSKERHRYQSFVAWPYTKPEPRKLAEAGFFYIGVDDSVCCFCCGIGLKAWDENDDPCKQHALHLRQCQYLKLIKGQAFIDSVKDEAIQKTRISQRGAQPQLEIQLQNCSISSEKDKLCKICYINEYETVFLPCGHVVACVKCASSFKKCPVCRNSFTNVAQIYFS